MEWYYKSIYFVHPTGIKNCWVPAMCTGESMTPGSQGAYILLGQKTGTDTTWQILNTEQAGYWDKRMVTCQGTGCISLMHSHLASLAKGTVDQAHECLLQEPGIWYMILMVSPNDCGVTHSKLICRCSASKICFIFQ